MISKNNILSYYFISIFLILISQLSFSQEKMDTMLFKTDFFDIENPVNLTLIFNVTELKRNKDDKNYLSGTLIYFSEDSTKITKNVRIKARGNVRKRHCNLPPFWININDPSINREEIADAKKIKFVSDCNYAKIYDEFVLKEYLAYKIFNLLTNKSFRVRLVNLKLVNTNNQNKESISLVFMIEPVELLTKRLNSMPLKMDNLNFYQMDSLSMDIISFFQYMIGNTDFAIHDRHNVKLLISKDFRENRPFPVPYDFDYSGLINTFYALPEEFFEISNVKERYFRGMCRSDSDFIKLIDYFLEKEDEIKSLIISFEYLEEKPKKEMLDYIEQFYLELKDPDFIKKIRTTCKKTTAKV